MNKSESEESVKNTYVSARMLQYSKSKFFPGGSVNSHQLSD
jgi:hypothetical protein